MKNRLLNKLLVGAGLAAPVLAFAQEAGGADYSSIVAAVSLVGVAGSIVAMGAVKIVPNVASWGTKKLVSFFR
jgi:hypothetical protein